MQKLHLDIKTIIKNNKRYWISFPFYLFFKYRNFNC